MFQVFCSTHYKYSYCMNCKYLLVSITIYAQSLSLQTFLTWRNDSRYAIAWSAQDFLMTMYGITHFEPEMYLPWWRNDHMILTIVCIVIHLEKWWKWLLVSVLSWNTFWVFYVADWSLQHWAEFSQMETWRYSEVLGVVLLFIYLLDVNQILTFHTFF